MTDAEKAYKAALQKIGRVRRAGGTALDLSGESFSVLDTVPLQIAQLRGLTQLDLSGTKVSDVSPLTTLTALTGLFLSKTRVRDLSPLSTLTNITALCLGHTLVTDLTAIASMTRLVSLRLIATPVTNLAPIATMTELEWLHLDETQVEDLRPIVGMGLLATQKGVRRALFYSNTPATQRDGALLRLSQIEDPDDSATQTLAYLNTLPPWPEPYTPETSGDGSPPAPIGALLEPPAPLPAVQAAETQIRTLLRNALVTQATAANLSEQIARALHGVQATQGNELAPILQMMAEVGEVLGNLADDPITSGDPEREQWLLLRIAQLEAIIERLTRALRDTEQARLAAEALSKKDGFLQSYRKSLGTAAGVGTVGLIGVGVPTAADYFLGADHPLVTAFLTVMGRLPKV